MGAQGTLRRGSVLTAVLLARMYLGVVVGLVAWSLLPLVLQWQPTVAMSGSMAPAIQSGDVLVAQPLTVETVDEEALRIGQVPLAKDPSNPGQLITHRIVGYAEDGYLTRGDANAQPDSAVLRPEDVIGIERLRIPFIGLPVHGMRTGDWLPVLTFAVLTVGAQLIVSHDSKANKMRRRRPDNTDRPAENHFPPHDDGDAGLGILVPAGAGTATAESAGAQNETVQSSDTAGRRRALAAAPALGILISGLVISGSTANFSATTFNAGNTLVANADFGPSEYSKSVDAADPWAYYRLDERATAVATDTSGNGWHGSYTGAVASTEKGALLRETNYALRLGGTAGTDASKSMYVDAAEPGPAEYSTEVWFKTTTRLGGALLTFGNATSALSSQYDRHIYMDDSGALHFGVYATSTDLAAPGPFITVTSPGTYADGQWHHVAATMGPEGMDLYVDGSVFVDGAAGIEDGTNNNTQSEPREGRWRIGGDKLDGWPGTTSANYFTGVIDEVAIYPRALTAGEISEHVELGRGGSSAYGPVVLADRPSHYFRFEEAGGPYAYNSVPAKAPAVYRTADVKHADPGILTSRKNRAMGFGAAGATTATPAVGTELRDTFTTEVWFKTTTTTGGWIMGLGQSPSGASNEYDRMVYMKDDGGLVFGVYRSDLTRPYQMLTSASGASYNDGLWHLVTATLSSAGMHLYLDGEEVGANPAITAGQPTSATAGGGYWRLGYENLNSWPDAPSSYEFEGFLDEFAVYPTALSPDQISARYAAA